MVLVASRALFPLSCLSQADIDDIIAKTLEILRIEALGCAVESLVRQFALPPPPHGENDKNSVNVGVGEDADVEEDIDGGVEAENE